MFPPAYDATRRSSRERDSQIDGGIDEAEVHRLPQSFAPTAEDGDGRQIKASALEFLTQGKQLFGKLLGVFSLLIVRFVVPHESVP